MWIQVDGHKIACVDSLNKLTTIKQLQDRLVEIQSIERQRLFYRGRVRLISSVAMETK